MAVANPRQRNAETQIVHREQIIRQTSKGQRPLTQRNAPEGKMWMEGTEKPPTPGVDSGASNKFTNKSPLVTTMGSTQKIPKGF
jgi:hypothetical protein